MEKKQGTKKSKTGMYVLIGLGVVAAAGTAIYFATKPKYNPDILDQMTDFEPERVASSAGSSSSGSSSSSSGFPLKKGSRGTLVKNVQEALIQKYGSDILPKYGADGHYGSETENALISKGLPTVISADLFKKIVTGTSSSSGSGKKKKKFRPALLAKSLRMAIIDDDLNESIRLLKKIWTVNGYKKVNEEFKKKRIGLTRKTLVNALLTQFWKKSEKKKLNAQFSRMGLKYDGEQWQLSGIGHFCDQIKSMQQTEVWNRQGKHIAVPENTILGEFLDAKHGVAKFKTLDDKILYTHTNTIGYV